MSSMIIDKVKHLYLEFNYILTSSDFSILISPSKNLQEE